jgi:hypothetical protein
MPRLFVRLALPLLLVAAVVKPARAEGPGPAANVPVVPLAAAPPERVWYGWQVLIVDLAALGAAIAADETDSVRLGGAAVLAYGVVSPLMHSRRSGWRSLGSLALRVGLPLAGMLATFDMSCGGNHSDPGDGSCSDGSEGALLGVAAAVILDDLFAFTDVKPAPLPASPPATRASLTPTLTFNRGTPGLGLAGTF